MDPELQPSSFTGLLIPDQPIRPQDFIHGDPANRLGGLGVRVIVADGLWDKYICLPQRQNKPGVYETFDCTGFAYCRDVATQLNAMNKLGLLSVGFLEWAHAKGYIQNDSFMFDPQVLGIMAGTTINGNWLQVVADTARKRGLAPAGSLPGVDAYSTAQAYYNEPIPANINALCQEFLTWVDLPYQWSGSLDDQTILKAVPPYVALATCSGWNTPPVPWCHVGSATNHAVVEVSQQEILDSYPPFLKQLSADYAIPYKMMILVTPRQGSSMGTLGFKLDSAATVYVEVGSKLVACADWQAFLNLGGDSNSVVTLTAEQFGKFEVATHDLFKSDN